MNKNLVKQLLLYIVSQLQDQEGIISKIRIVKMLYLIDVEHYRAFGRTLTGLGWIFYHYGPYAFEIDTAIKELGFDLGEEEIETSEGYTGYTYRVSEPPDLGNVVSYSVQSLINRIVNRWALEDTNIILDYVYSGTEPMQFATFQDNLDFSKIRRGLDVNRPMKHIQIAKDKSAKIQQLLKQRPKTKKRAFSPKYDKTYFEAVNAMDQEDKFDGKIAGRVTISPKAAETISQQIE